MDSNIDYVAMGKRIREKRTLLGITQQKLSELSGVEPSNISHIERGATKLSLPTLIKIANALGTSVDELLCDNIYKSNFGGSLKGFLSAFSSNKKFNSSEIQDLKDWLDDIDNK